MDLSRLMVKSESSYTVRLAQDEPTIRAALALRYEVFNLELHEGLEASSLTGLDRDPFDDVCSHLVVEHVPTREVVGTYRVQTGVDAAAKLGYYSEQEFDFTPFEPIRGELLELGRACVHKSHRNLVVLGLLWKGIGQFAKKHHGRYLVGCSSLTSQDPAVGAAAYLELSRQHLVDAAYRTLPRPGWVCPLEQPAPETPKTPKLLRAYLSIGAQICGPPALDAHFKTIDFLTFLDLKKLMPSVINRFLGG